MTWASWSAVREILARAIGWIARFIKLHGAAAGFALSGAFFVFLCGLASGYYGLFPAPQLKSAISTARVLRAQIFGPRPNTDEGFAGFSNVPRAQIAAKRIVSLAHLDGPAAKETFVVTGGKNQYYDLCPEHGCVAVQYDRSGRVLHAWPFRPAEFSEKRIVNHAYEAPLFDPERNVYSSSLQILPGGDLIAVFHDTFGFPSGGGIARIAPDGHFKWYRRDFAHHWPTVTPDGEILALGDRIMKQPLPIVIDGVTVTTLDCPADYLNDTIRVLDLDGRLKREISILDAVVGSPYRGLLLHTINKCDPLHPNYVTPVGAAIAAHVPGVAPGDFLVSMRHISAFAIISRQTGRLLRLYRGSFALQHSVQPYEGSKVIMFDNLGAGPDGGPSRVLLYDLSNGGEETVFPRAGSAILSFFSIMSGNIALSVDRQRMLVAVTAPGTGYEVRISDGAVLTKFDNLSDISKLANFTAEKNERAGRFSTFGLYYGK